jgi:predicted GNAT superfamily acetyltransferase
MSSHLTAATPGILIRKCHALEDFHQCVALQREIWEEQDLEVEPATAFVVAANTGGQVLGAFDHARLVGFTLALVGLRDGLPYLHSHMTGVHPQYRDRGVGRMLKLFQREEALGRNIRTICWTFDPLELRNAHFNLNRLGAICRTYLPNFYGVTTSPLHRGLATDRLLAEWHLESPRTIAAVAGVPVHIPDNAAVIELASTETPTPPPDPGQDTLEIPQDTQHLHVLQARLRDNFQKYFHRGYAAIAVRTGTSPPAYVLYPWSDF